MNMILLEDPSARQTLHGRQFDHLKTVLKAVPGSRCKVGLRNGKLGQAEVLAMRDDCAELSVALTEPPPQKLNLTLAMALPRPQTLKKVIHIAVSMGVPHIAFFHSFKVEKSYWQSPCITPDALDREQILALEQCCDTVPATISFHPKFRPFAEEDLPRFAAGKTALVAHPAAVAPPPDGLAGDCGVVLVLGPEGGFNDFEYELLLGQGLTGITLGRRILRTEVALPALLGRLFR